MQEPDKLVRIKYQGAVPSWIDSVFQNIPDRLLLGEFYEAIGFDESGKSFHVKNKDVQVQFYNASQFNWATFFHVRIYFFHLNDITGYNRLLEVFNFGGTPPKEKDFTQTVIGFIDEPFAINTEERENLITDNHVEYHEIDYDDIDQFESILQNIINRSLKLGHLMKVCLLGDSKKTDIIRKYADDKFSGNYLPTLGVDITTKHTNFHGLQVKVILVDTASQEFFGKLRPNYYRGASSGIIFFDISMRTSVSQIIYWIEEFHKIAIDVPLALVGLLTNEETSEPASIKQFVKEYEIPFSLMTPQETAPISLILEQHVKILFTRKTG
jgi:GTPase SAR1 family protein